MADELKRLEQLTAAGVDTDCRTLLRAWITTRRSLRHSLPQPTYRHWIRPLRPVGATDSAMLLTAPDNVRAWVERRYTALIGEALQGTGFDRVEFVAEVAP